MARKAIDMTGQVFGYLKAEHRAGRSGAGKSALWVCKCQLCGRLTVVSRVDLLSGKIKSCGCLLRMTKDQKQALPGAAAPERREAYEQEESTLCWNCANAVGGCSWSQSFEPVEGWDAVPCIIRGNGIEVPSFRVLSCPLFERD